MISFNNTYSKLPESFYQRNNPEKFKDPKLLCFNRELATSLNIDYATKTDEELALIFSGKVILPGSEPLSQAYAGYQFGYPSPQLGDGRAHLLGETAGFDIQLKGSGRSRFSRQGDGYSALGPVVREYLVSEAMFHLGVPTTRALAAVRTGESVTRQFGPEPGAIFTRVAESHMRVGTFQYFSFREDNEALEILLDYAIKRHCPTITSNNLAERTLSFIKSVAKKQADLVATWSALGFVHGVMNTDNFSVAGITIDYGPCAFLDEFQFGKVFSSIDTGGRYSYWNQVPIAQWNILRLAEALLPLIDEEIERAAATAQEALEEEMEYFTFARGKALARKLGIENYTEKEEPLVKSFLEYLEREELDFTLSFRNLPELYSEKKTYFPKTRELEQFLEVWRGRVTNIENLNKINPLYIPRNHQIERAIKMCNEGDDSVFFEMLELLKTPFVKNKRLDFYKEPPLTEQRVSRTFCGT